MKVRKRAKIRNQYNQATHLTQGTKKKKDKQENDKKSNIAYQVSNVFCIFTHKISLFSEVPL